MFFFFFNDTATTEIYTLSPTRRSSDLEGLLSAGWMTTWRSSPTPELSVRTPLISFNAICTMRRSRERSEEHTSELQSQSNLVCRLLLEKKNTAPLTSSPASDDSTA